MVLILAFDCSSSAGSVAVLDGPRVLARQSLDPAKRSAKTLAPAVELALRQAAQLPGDLQLIATTVGPGSFTGLRVGVTMAKTLAYALKCDVLGLNTLDVIAAQAALPDLRSSTGVIHAVLDAQRKELFVGRYEWRAGQPLVRLDDGQTILPAEEWLRTLQPGNVVTGAGLVRWKARLPAEVMISPAEVFEPDASTIGQLAFHQYQSGRRDDLWTLSPLYIRPSYAEEKK